MPGFLGIERVSQGPWQALERSLQRLLVHAGFDDVRLVGGPGDGGGDIVASSRGLVWVVQSKFRSGAQSLGPDAIEEVAGAIGKYGASRAVLATNVTVTQEAILRAEKLEKDIGIPIYIWEGKKLLERFR